MVALLELHGILQGCGVSQFDGRRRQIEFVEVSMLFQIADAVANLIRIAGE